MNKVEYLSSLTALRGIAALWVVLFHIDVSLYYRDLSALLPREQTGLLSHGYLWVDFFFLLSGFIICHVYGNQLKPGLSKSTVGQYLLSRAARLYPLHLFTLVILVLLSAIVPLFYPEVVDDSWRGYFDWAAMPSQLLFTNAMSQHYYLSWNIVSWSIGAEWWTYFIAIGLLVAINNRDIKYAFITMVLAFCLLAGLVFWHHGKNLDITFDFGFLRCLFEFSIGIALYQFYRQALAIKWLGNDLIFIALLFGIAMIFHWQLHDLLVIPLFSMLIISAGYNNGRISNLLARPVFQYLGRISYSLYLVHGVMFMVFWFLLPQLTDDLAGEPSAAGLKLSYMMAFLALSVILADFCHRHVEIKGRRLVKRYITSWSGGKTQKLLQKIQR